MRIPLYQVDAFASEVFRGNPAAVCPLEAWLDESVMQAIAAENNLAETAFFVAEGEKLRIRWFTPAKEVDLCGHATLASAHVIFEHLDRARREITFASMSGDLAVSKGADGRIAMIFPSRPPVACGDAPALREALGGSPREVLAARDYFAVYASEDEVRALSPDMALLTKLDRDGIIVTAPGTNGVDFVSRFFAPQLGIPEDPVTGSAHCTLIPYWAKRLGKAELRAFQCSQRGGELACEDRGASVVIAGRAVRYLEGAIFI